MPHPAKRSAARPTTRRARTALAMGLMAGLAGLGAPQALANPATTPGLCNADGIDWANDPIYRRNRHHSETSAVPRGPVICTVMKVVEQQVGGTQLRLTLGRLNVERPDGVRLPVRMVTITQLGGDGTTAPVRVLIDDDPVNRMEIFEPQFRDVEGTILIRIAPRHDRLFAIRGQAVSIVPAFEWQDALRASLPDDQRGGRILKIDLETMEGWFALRKAGTDVGKPLPSAFDPSHMAVAKLAFRDGKLVFASSAIRERKPGDVAVFDDFTEADEAARKAAGRLPAGVEACSLAGWSTDKDPEGLNVRAEPHAKAKVLGLVPPPRRDAHTEDQFGPEPVKSEFAIFGYRDGWFLIGNITAPGARYELPAPRKANKPFKGRGWVNARLVGGALANGGLPTGQLHVSPNADSAAFEVRGADGNRIELDGTPFTLLACSGWWGLVEFPGGHRGWWRSICSNQVTNCS